METKVNYDRLHLFTFEEQNPKEHNLGEIELSIKRFGFIELPVVNDTTGILVAGHGRISALQGMYQRQEDLPRYIDLEKETNEWLVPTLHVKFETDAEAKAYLIASNTLTMDGGWNEAMLMEMLSEIDASTGSLLGTGFDQQAVMDMLHANDKPMFEEDFGQQTHKVVVPAADIAQAEEIKYALEELGYECQVKTTTK